MSTPRRWRIVHSESEIGWGGQEHRIIAELTGFHRRKSEVLLLAPFHSIIFERARKLGLPAQNLEVRKFWMPWAIFDAALRLRRFQPDVVNLHSSRDSWIVGLASRLARVPLVVRTRHIDVSYPNGWLSRHAYVTLADHLLTTSQKITDHFLDFFKLPPSRVTTLPTGIDLQRFSADIPPARLPASVPAGSRCIAMISVLRSWKGHPVFIEAARKLHDRGFAAHYLIAGEGDGRPEFENLVRAAGLEHLFHFLGHREDVPQLLRSIDLLVIPSTKHEGIPQIGLQALASKTPVVGSDVGGIPEIIRPRETGRIFPTGDASALAAAIESVFLDLALTRTLAEQGRAMVEREHSLDQMLDRLEALYAAHLSSRPQA